MQRIIIDINKLGGISFVLGFIRLNKKHGGIGLDSESFNL